VQAGAVSVLFAGAWIADRIAGPDGSPGDPATAESAAAGLGRGVFERRE
jgi:hypothetical protein